MHHAWVHGALVKVCEALIPVERVAFAWKNNDFGLEPRKATFDSSSESKRVLISKFLENIKCRNSATLPVKKTTSQNVGPKLIRINKLIQTVRSAVSKNPPRFFFAASAAKFWKRDTVARRREHFRGFLTIFLVTQLPSKRVVLVHKISLASCQRCRHSVEPRALKCPFK